MSPQTVPTMPTEMKNAEESQKATGSNPVAPTTYFPTILEHQPVLTDELFPIPSVESEKSPQSSPIAARLSRQELRELIGICSREITYTGLSQDAGQRALALREKLQLIHAHGWQS